MAIARTSAEAVVGDQIWLIPGTNDRNYTEPYKPILATVTKVARLYLTIQGPEGSRWGFGQGQYERGTGQGKAERGYTNYRRVMGYEQRRQWYYLNLTGELAKELQEMRQTFKLRDGVIRVIEEVAFAMGRAHSPDFSDPEFKE